ncbi:MAG TPA: DMT family transporter [Anaerolineae bacterium]|nr:DMT family transporter [Anaerolineae bacterium]
MTDRNRSTRLGLMDLALLATVFIWGANFPVVKYALAELTPMTYNALRFGGASLLTLLLAWLVERNLRIERSDWGYFLMLSLIGNLIYEVLFINGLALSRAGNTSLILSTAPIWVAVLGTATGQERLSAVNWVGVLLSFGGLFVLTAASTAGLVMGRGALVGGLLVLASAFCWSVYTLLLKRMVHKYSSLVATAWVMALTSPLLILAAAPDLRAQNWHAVSSRSWLGLLYSTVLAISIGYTVWSTGVKHVGSARTAVYSYLTPLISVSVAWITLGETMHPWQAVGAAAIVVGVVLGRLKAGT